MAVATVSVAAAELDVDRVELNIAMQLLKELHLWKDLVGAAGITASDTDLDKVIKYDVFWADIGAAGSMLIHLKDCTCSHDSILYTGRQNNMSTHKMFENFELSSKVNDF